MADSLRASEQGLEIIDKARRLKGWTRFNSAAWWQKAYSSRSTLQRFWKQENITRDKFIAICEAVGIRAWEKIAEPQRIDLSTLSPDLQQDLIQHLPKGMSIQNVTAGTVNQSGTADPPVNPFRGWEKAPDLDRFFGRDVELQQLRAWIQEGCKLIAILGMGGIGKTSLVVALADELQNDFDCFLWYNLTGAPSLQTFLTDITPFLVEQPPVSPFNYASGNATNLLNYLQKYRCLLVLDNAESILDRGEHTVAGHYRSGYEDYEGLFRQIGEGRHQSCLLITSREQPQGLTRITGHKVRCMSLRGLPPAMGYRILQDLATPPPQIEAWHAIVNHYGGNPLALKIVAAGIRNYLGGDLAYFLERLQSGSFPFNDIRDLLQHHLERLSDREQEVLFWLAIVREPIPLPELESCLLSTLSRQELPATLESLHRRSLLEMTGIGYTLQPVIMEYLVTQLIAEIVTELLDWSRHLAGNPPIDLSNAYLNTYALMQATAKDYIRDTQRRFLVQPVLEQVGSTVLSQLDQLLEHLRQHYPRQPGYLTGNLLNLIAQRDRGLRGVDCSHLVIRQAYLRGVNLHQVNFTQAEFQQVVFSETISNVLGVAFHPDGRTLATVDDQGWLYLWDILADRQMASTKAHLEWIFALAFSPDGCRLATAGLDWVVKLWQWDGQHLVLERQLEGHTIGVATVVFSPDGRLLASASADKTVKLWEVPTGTCRHTLQGHRDIVRTVAFSPDGQTLASGSWDQTVRLWDVETGACSRILEGHTGQVESLSLMALASCPPVLISGSYDRTVKLWDLQTGACLQTLTGHRDRVCIVTWGTIAAPSRDEAPQILIASAGDDGTIRLWDGRSGESVKTLFAGEDRIWTLAFSPQGNFLASGGQNSLLKLWEVQTGQCWKTVQGAENQTMPFGFSPNDQIVYTYSYREQHLRHWDWRTGTCLKVLPLQIRAAMDVRLRPDGQAVVVGGFDHIVKLFEIESGTCLQNLIGHQGWVRALAFSADSRWLVSGSGDGTARLWDLESGTELHCFAGHASPVQCVALNPAATLLATGSWDHTIKLWEVQTGHLLRTLEKQHPHRIEDIVFSLDGTQLYSCSLDGTIRVWQVETGACSLVWQQPGAGVVCLNLSPDGNLLACASYRGGVTIRQLPQGTVLNVLEGNLMYGISAFTADGQTIAIRGIQGDCQLYHVFTGELLQTLQMPRPYEAMNITGALGLTQAQRQTLQALGAIEA
ncbi:hypothetical protein BST81_03465 [Leptolyngbya sp. 'hensonii']|uniref:NB-ARC domain-containing protein n=1 Tax=Leptolyngbya sp. 'hensonii' TaxID=1922337 RepID=UPI00094FE6ED|nr:NB-ARC domain-containing protein [Leptolyngbya sp. 'hensonii']OLP19845.1 hypothetical protein BST81_03465 [Leptolyngbya sp. 'hensonii']